MAVSSNTQSRHGDQAPVARPSWGDYAAVSAFAATYAAAHKVAHEHIRWCIADGWTLAEVILRAGQPLPGHRRAIWFEDAIAAVALAWLMLEGDAMSEAAERPRSVPGFHRVIPPNRRANEPEIG